VGYIFFFSSFDFDLITELAQSRQISDPYDSEYVIVSGRFSTKNKITFYFLIKKIPYNRFLYIFLYQLNIIFFTIFLLFLFPISIKYFFLY
jgi:hypothetical protein